MFEYISAAILGVAEGLTEFLPVSSTGHLILLNRWFSFGKPFTELFDIVIQSGAILAVILLFWKDLWPLSWADLKKKWGIILLAFLPTGAIAFLFSDYAQAYLFNPLVVSAALVFYGVVFLALEKKGLKGTKENISWKHALAIGSAQALALVPGTSRSGSTIICMLLLGYSRPAAARFSFLLAVPTLLAAGGYSLLKYDDPITANQAGILAIGFAMSFVSAWLVSRWFMSFISRKDFTPFAWYRIALGLIVAVSLLV